MVGSIETDPTPLHAGDHVLVWNRYLDTWAGDFEVVETRSEGVQVRPRSQPGTALPRLLDGEQIRLAEPRHHP